jgi:hypothetical protein
MVSVRPISGSATHCQGTLHTIHVQNVRYFIVPQGVVNWMLRSILKAKVAMDVCGRTREIISLNLLTILCNLMIINYL